MKAKWILCLILLAVLPLSSSALVITRSSSNSTTDDDDNTQEIGSSSRGGIGSTSATVTTVGNSSGNMGTRFAGQAAAYDTGAMTQSIDVTVTWTVTAEEWEEYSITISPELHAWLNIFDDGGQDEKDDVASFGDLSSILRVNGSIVSDTLDGLTGLERSTHGSSILNRTDSQTLTGYSGNNIFSLQLTGTVSVDAHTDGGLFDYPTGNAVLWGQDGTLNFSRDSGFDEYATDEERVADGIFVDANITLNAVPEPASALMVGFSAVLLGMGRRFYSRCC